MVEKYLPKLIRAGLEDDKKSFEVISLTLAQKIKKRNPIVSDEINQILFDKNIRNETYRSIGLDRLPTNKKNDMNLLKVEECDEIIQPILEDDIMEKYCRFIDEQYMVKELLEIGVKPSNTILLYGEPGVGKTLSAKWLANKLNKPLMILDLSTVISSYLGETGVNLKKVLDYARGKSSILFLDEFDAIAKKRNDERELGEIKRIVNVLLKELEDWPIGDIIIAATNHPELLDKAMWRRFDLKINIRMPDKELRHHIIDREFKNFDIPKVILAVLAECTDSINSAEVVRMCDDIKKDYILTKKDIEIAILDKIRYNLDSARHEVKAELVWALRNDMQLSVEEIVKVTNISKSSVYRYLNRGE